MADDEEDEDVVQNVAEVKQKKKRRRKRKGKGKSDNRCGDEMLIEDEVANLFNRNRTVSLIA